MARKRPGHILPFRIPFFRIFYSTTYTTIYVICICLLAITPVSMIWSAIQSTTYQYVIMIGGTYILTASMAIFIYASRLYTNRTAMASIGKPYIPIEDGELGKSVRKMIVNQLERSAIVAWESRPRDLHGEILRAESAGFLPPETASVGRDDYVVGREIPIDPSYPPWGDIKHAGWSSPSHASDNVNPSLQFATVIAELPNLIEAQAVSLAPADPLMTPSNGPPIADPVVADVLRRPETMGMRDYLTHLSYLGLVKPLEIGQSFLLQYERARFGGLPTTEQEFNNMMASFSALLAGMRELSPAIVDQIRMQAGDGSSDADTEDFDAEDQDRLNVPLESVVSPKTPSSSIDSPVTARTAPSRSMTPYLYQDAQSQESLTSVIHQPSNGAALEPLTQAESFSSFSTDAGSVIRHGTAYEDG